MSNLRDVHLKIKEISNANSGGRPHIHVNELAAKLNITTNELMPFLNVLYSTAFIDYYKDCKDVVALTETGLKNEIPLQGNREKTTTSK